MTAEFTDPGATKHQSTKGSPVVITLAQLHA
ncbi:hypothetical protein FAM21834_01279 [Lentilactobacillus parabuchneri]|uniref:Uncharacterized protein n=1 Tax=Lentilactobacillus parabuchneri TaxID=152331 RepID=A0A1X1FEW4_9LACO|nr:hypothetical protein FAM21731_01221 [Lentilactobacillus parabuchneri]ORM95987.1 hypothetical protein FAM21809_01258 [Lentilactobacillus parabuchneri]ORN00848.1 hypothetical protein FAM21823_01264 [Lentilactobacillus parabuchneri]ORN04724.1 hypothetical protein FAM21829_01067 [Lentilactobacillus parabuchneri]ORN08843.1 hypothetical protein FAM23163_01070 [Lentilactobacillus parabuchneri]